MKTKIRRSLCLRFDRTLSDNPLRQAFILLCVLAVAFVVSYILLSVFGGNWQDYCKANNINEWAFPLYLLIDGNAFNQFYTNPSVSRGTVIIACLISSVKEVRVY